MHSDLVAHATVRTDKIIVLEEKRVRIIINNPEQHVIHQIAVDNGLIADIARVDYALRREGSGDLLVELKGSDIEKACDQVESTIRRWKERRYSEGRLSALVVSNRRPNVATEWQIKSRRILKNYGVVTKFESSGKTLEMIDLLPDPPEKQVSSVGVPKKTKSGHSKKRVPK